MFVYFGFCAVNLVVSPSIDDIDRTDSVRACTRGCLLCVTGVLSTCSAELATTGVTKVTATGVTKVAATGVTKVEEGGVVPAEGTGKARLAESCVMASFGRRVRRCDVRVRSERLLLGIVSPGRTRVHNASVGLYNATYISCYV